MTVGSASPAQLVDVFLALKERDIYISHLQNLLLPTLVSFQAAIFNRSPTAKFCFGSLLTLSLLLLTQGLD